VTLVLKIRADHPAAAPYFVERPYWVGRLQAY